MNRLLLLICTCASAFIAPPSASRGRPLLHAATLSELDLQSWCETAGIAADKLSFDGDSATVTQDDVLEGRVALVEGHDLGEDGAPGRAAIGGMSFNFKGTGRDVCVFVDPETVGWHQSVSRQTPTAGFVWPDNFKDDGDIDLYAGVSVYYSGSPGFEIGGFEVRYQDSLGNEIPVEFNECTIVSPDYPNGGAHSGRAMPEFCTLDNTQTGVDYTVVLETFSPPADDNRLGYGLIFADASCGEITALMQANLINSSECLILGESIDPRHEHNYEESPFLAVGGAEAEQYSWEGSTTIEQLFCDVKYLFN